MGDVGDFWRDVRAACGPRPSRGRPAATLVKFTKRHAALGFVQFTNWHWQVRLAGGLLDYYPSKDKWRYLNENHVGTFADLKSFIKATTPTPSHGLSTGGES